MPQIIEADLTWTGQRFERDVCVEVGHDGTIGALHRDQGVKPTRRLKSQALLPGFVNAHSHAFQRGLRGLGETFPAGQDTFWNWRDRMYELVESMTDQHIYDLSRQAFREMLAAGITTVGEFHYLHHDVSGAGYAFDDAVLSAAAEEGIRIVLLEAFYRTGDIGAPLSVAQQRFATPSLDDYLGQLDALAGRLKDTTQSLGVVAHSIRAASPDDIVALHQAARDRGFALHLHVEEQQREIDACKAAYGAAPMALLNERLEIGPDVTAVHCTHTDRGDLDAFVAAGGNVCICPLTEANLADGLADVQAVAEKGAHLCLGTDSNARISMIEEARWLEYGQRLKHQRRGQCVDASGDLAHLLLAIATSGGARALGIEAGRIETGALADLATVDLANPALAGWSETSLLPMLLLGACSEAIGQVCVGGRWVEPDRPALLSCRP
jgi:formimidoylglutamate deiminase